MSEHVTGQAISFLYWAVRYLLVTNHQPIQLCSLFLATSVHDDLKIWKVLGLDNTCYGEQSRPLNQLFEHLLNLAT